MTTNSQRDITLLEDDVTVVVRIPLQRSTVIVLIDRGLIRVLKDGKILQSFPPDLL